MKHFIVSYCFLALILSAAWHAKADEDDDDGGKKKKDKETVGTVIGIDLGTTYSW